MSEVRVADKMALSTMEAARVAGVGLSALYRAIADGSLIARRNGRKLVVLRADLQDWLNRLPAANGGKPAGQQKRKINI